jgi:hypothetical protein
MSRVGATTRTNTVVREGPGPFHAPTIVHWITGKRPGISTNDKPAPESMRQVFGVPDPPPPPLVGVTYGDEAGLTVSRNPARYAAGALIPSWSARRRRGSPGTGPSCCPGGYDRIFE